jgi:hypothetical protein
MTSLPDLELNTDYQASAAAASDKVSASRLDGDHVAIVSWINDRLLPTLARLIRDDDTLVDGVVRYRNLHAEIIASLSGLTWLEACAVATTGAITLSGLQTIDGYTTLAGDRVLVTAQVSAIANGIYVAAVGSWARASDAASGATLAASVAVAITNGTAYGASWWKAAAAALVGSDSVTWLRINVPGVGTIPRGGTGATTPSAWPTPRRLMARVVAVANVAVAAPGATIDGITLVSGDRVLLTAQSTGSQNGLWQWNGAAVTMTRPVDYPAAGALQAFLDLELVVREGAAYASTVWRCSTATAITIDTTATSWALMPVQLAGAGIAGLLPQANVGAITATGGTTARTLAARFADVLTPYDFGAVGNGTTDDTTAFQTAMNAAATAGALLNLPPGTYRIRSQLTIPSGLTMSGPGRVLLDPASYLDKALRALGSEATAINLTVNAVAGDTTVTVASTAGLSAGQMVLMRSNILSNEFPQEALVVDSLTGTTVTFRTPLTAAYATANTGRIVPLTPKTDITIAGVWFDCGASSDIGYLLSLEYVRNARVTDCRFTNHRTITSPGSQAAVLVNSALQCRVDRCMGAPAVGVASGGNLLSFAYGSQLVAHGNESSGYAFGIGAFYATGVSITGNVLRGIRSSGNRGVKTSGCYGVMIAANDIATFDSGVKDQDSRDVSITGNVIAQCCFDSTGTGINVSNAQATTNEAATHAITGNVVRGMLGLGILVDVGSYHAVVTGNQVEDCQGIGIKANAQHVLIANNYVRNWGLAYVGVNAQNFAGIFWDRSATVVNNRGHNTLTTVPLLAVSANATASTGEQVAGNLSATNDLWYIGTASAGQIGGAQIAPMAAVCLDPTRRWVGSVGGYQASKSMTNAQVFTVSAFNDGMLFSVVLGGGQAALFFACNASATISLLSDPSAQFSITSGTGSRFNVFKSAASGVISFQNNTGSTVNVGVSFVGTRIASITDPA